MARAELTLMKPLENAKLTVTVNMTRQFRVRLWLGTTLLVLAARVLGCAIEFKE